MRDNKCKELIGTANFWASRGWWNFDYDNSVCNSVVQRPVPELAEINAMQYGHSVNKVTDLTNLDDVTYAPYICKSTRIKKKSFVSAAVREGR